MNVEFKFHLSEKFPTLGWLAILLTTSPRVEVFHGSSVEVSDRCFIEGAWAGDFARGNPAHSECMFGSAGQVDDNKVTFVSATATTDCIYYCVTENETFVSNSLPLILWRVEDGLDDEKCTQYAHINNSITMGITRYMSEIPTRNHIIRRVVHKNMEFTDGKLTLIDKPPTPPFESFSSYKTYLTSRIGQIIANARDRARAQPLRIYSTQSKGYDTTAVNAIGRDFCIDGVFTIRQGKSNNAYTTNMAEQQPDDDGSEICNALGLTAISLDRREFMNGVPNELFYWAGLHRACDFNLCGMARSLQAPALLLTGKYGDVLFGSRSDNYHKLSGEMGGVDIGGHGLMEIRLKAGFTTAAVFAVGARRFSDIVKISESEEMLPWRLGTAYDRPIARRLGEESGVPRHLFGQKKVASVVEVPPPEMPFDLELRKQYLDFLHVNRLLPHWKSKFLPLVHRYNTFVTFKGPSQNLYAYYADRAVFRTSGMRLTCLWSHLDGSIYCFAVNTLVDDYRAGSAGWLTASAMRGAEP